MDKNQQDEILTSVRQHYGSIAQAPSSGCGCGTSPCCESEQPTLFTDYAEKIGYSPDELLQIPEGSNLGLGCGNPTAIASLRPGEAVLDLGSGAGFDCFLAAKQVGEDGFVIGVDMTPEMLSKARQNAAKGAFTNVEFRLGEIEHLPVGDASIDVTISNCVINLSPDKKKVFAEAFRVLKPGGRLAVSDIITTADLPDHIRNDLALYAGCVSGAASLNEIESFLRQVGFEHIRITPKESSREFIREWAPELGIERFTVSANIEAVKPK